MKLRHKRQTAKKASMQNRKFPARDQYADDLGGFHSFIQAITDTIFNIDGNVGPLVIAEIKGRSDPLMIPCSGGDVNRFFAQVQPMLEEHGVDRAAKVGEVWVSEYPKGTSNITLRPSLDPNRKEMVKIIARERGGAGLSSIAWIIRPAGSTPPYLAPWESVPTNDGPLLGMTPMQ
jgi:hypothetical protein